MVPFAAPNKPVLFKYIHNLLRDAVCVSNGNILGFAFTVPLPVIGVRGVDIHRHAETVHTVPVGTCNITPGKSTADIGEVLFELGMFIQLL